MPAAVAQTPSASFPLARDEPWWRDPRFVVPGAFVGLTIASSLLFALGHRLWKSRPTPVDEPRRDSMGYVFPEQGYVLCPQGRGLTATTKPITVGAFVILWLGDPSGAFVESTWARVLRIDTADPNRIFVIIAGEETPVGQRALKSDLHGFNLSQAFWMTADCVVDVLEPLRDARGVLLCGAHLLTFDGPDDDFQPDGYHPAVMPDHPRRLVGREVELLMVSKAGKGSAWQVPIVARITEVGSSGHLARLKVLEIGRDEFADDPQTGHSVRPGDEFDVVWDCITKYRS